MQAAAQGVRAAACATAAAGWRLALPAASHHALLHCTLPLQETDDGVWNVSMAAGTCLALCASVAGDAIVQLVMPFVTANIQKTDAAEAWRLREVCSGSGSGCAGLWLGLEGT